MPVTVPATPISFFDNTFEEALALTRQARSYFASRDMEKPIGATPEAQLLTSCESMRVTARLTQVVAWFLVQKAVHNGEMPKEEALKPEYRLQGHGVCDQDSPEFDADMPTELRSLLDQSHRLYQRVARLDALLDQA